MGSQKWFVGGFLLALGALTSEWAHSADSLKGLRVEAERLEVAPGRTLELLVSRPESKGGRLPALVFVQWLSCDTVRIGTEEDGWSRFLSELLRGSDYVGFRLEKAGVGNSDGPACKELDHDTELRDHATALTHIFNRDDVDPSRVILVGASMGARMAPLLAADQPLAGIAVWGGGGQTWFERMLTFERNALELEGSTQDIDEEMRLRSRFLHDYLVEGRSPQQIASSDAELGAVFDRLVGTDDGLHYGRSPAFHQQAQRHNVQAAWARVGAPVLVLYGEHDWFESMAAQESIVRAVRRAGGRATLRVIPGLDHHFMRYPDAAAAFSGRDGEVASDAALDVLQAWINQRLD